MEFDQEILPFFVHRYMYLCYLPPADWPVISEESTAQFRIR